MKPVEPVVAENVCNQSTSVLDQRATCSLLLVQEAVAELREL